MPLAHCSRHGRNLPQSSRVTNCWKLASHEVLLPYPHFVYGSSARTRPDSTYTGCPRALPVCSGVADSTLPLEAQVFCSPRISARPAPSRGRFPGTASAEALLHPGSRSAPLPSPRPRGLRRAPRRRHRRRHRRRRRLRRRRRCRPGRRPRSASGRAWNPRILRGRGRRRSVARRAQPQPCHCARRASAGPRCLQLLQRCRGSSVRSLSGIAASSTRMRHIVNKPCDV